MKRTQIILIVDDEATIREVVRRYLEREGFRVTEAADGYAALDALDEKLPDLMILDLMLPGVDGLTITRLVRQRRHIPIIILTARGETSDRVRGLDLGADDYLGKPFSPQELVSRVKAVLRRTGKPPPLPGEMIAFEALQIDPAARTVCVQGNFISLSAREFDLLLFFARHPRQVFSRSQILQHVWGDDYYGDPSTVTVHIRRLREKIEPDSSRPRYILTVWGVGYKFAVGDR